ncbi:Uncharacterised protein [uncultured archaeon]|nr:Uncharacterised protein [uncultured archaeon]
MKHIVKDKNTPKFDRWMVENVNCQPTYGGVQGETKKDLKNSLMKEQGYICCYCERRLTNDDSHIEHFTPQSNPGVDGLDYTNMLCSCQDKLKQGEPRHCGNLKDNWFDGELLVSPLDPECERRFIYTADGKIHPAIISDDAAITTIQRLGLNIPKLNALREKAIEPFLDEMDEQELSRFVVGFLIRNSDGMFGEFWTTIDYIFGE